MVSRGKRNDSNPLKKSLIFTHDKLVPMVICVIGLTVQVLSLFTLYFSFPTTTVIDLYRPKKVDLPSISLCFLYSIHEDEIAKAIHARDELNYIELVPTTYDLTIAELDQLTPGVENYIVSCKVANASIDPNQLFNTVDCDEVCPVQTALSPKLKCFTWFAQIKNQYHYQRNDFYDDSFLSIGINTNLSNARFTLVFVHDNDEEVVFSNGSPEMTILDFTLYNKFVLTYYTKSTFQLGAPYSNCVDYFKSFGSSKRNLVKKCMSDNIFKEHHAFHHRALVAVSYNVSNATFIRNIPMSKYRSDCEATYPDEECEDKLFEVKTLHSELESDKEFGLMSVHFSFPLGLQSSVKMIKKFNDIEFFCYIASIISLWLEVSMLTVAKFLFYHLRKLILHLIRRNTNAIKFYRSTNNQGQKTCTKKIKVLSNSKITGIPTIYGSISFYPRYARAFEPRYPVPFYFY